MATLTLHNRKIEGYKTAFISLDIGLLDNNTLSRSKNYKITIEEEVEDKPFCHRCPIRGSNIREVRK